jgi:hypothetical protein
MSYAERQERNALHIEKPMPGDYWHEMFCPYHVVLAADDEYVTICDKKIDLKDGWTFDLSETKQITHLEHRNIVTYTSMRDKFVADVVPNSKLMPAVQEWRDNKREELLKQIKGLL